ncbi:MAG: hypothetical protein PHP50_09875, partial [Lachnospiraceae bacterium]|nr:hypothetical protein [Lachnospiraceae bacterium]
FYDFETFMQDIYQMNLLQFGRNVLVVYLAEICIYGIISYVIYARRYTKAKASLKCYYNNLKRLASLYER